MSKCRIALVNGVVSVEETTKEMHNVELLERQCGVRKPRTKHDTILQLCITTG